MEYIVWNISLRFLIITTTSHITLAVFVDDDVIGSLMNGNMLFIIIVIERGMLRSSLMEQVSKIDPNG